MPSLELAQVAYEVLIVLAAGLAASVVCRKLGISLLVGYLVVGAVIGGGGLKLIQSNREAMELLAEAGALLLLFSVGIEFSLTELFKLWRFFLIGGAVQMTLTALPVLLLAKWAGWTWPAAALVAGASALSSTVLVFRALHELQQADTPHGRRGLGILLFQDMALVPLLMLLPMLTGRGPVPDVLQFVALGLKSILIVLGVWAGQKLIRRWIVPMIAHLRSVEIVVLFALCVVGGLCWVAVQLDLPAAVGALAAGLMLSGNRLSGQIDSILLPFRESFSAVFFVTLGMLLQPLAFLHEPLLLIGALLLVVTIKTVAAAVALRCTGLRWRPAAGLGLGMSQLGEFSFLLIADGANYGLIQSHNYNRILFIAIATLIATPQLIRYGLRDADDFGTDAPQDHGEVDLAGTPALVIGIGPIGRQVTSRLEMMGVDACLVDLSPINLQPFAQLGFRTFSGDAREPAVLERLGASACRLAVVCVPNDDVALQIARSLRISNRRLRIVVRCRFQAKVHEFEEVGVDGIISEEVQASAPLVAMCEQMLHAGPRG